MENVLAHEGVFDGKSLDMERVSEVLKEPMKGYSNLVMRAEGLSAENQQALMDKYSSLIDKIDNQDGVKLNEEHPLNSSFNDVSDWGQTNSASGIYNSDGIPNKKPDMILSTTPTNEITSPQSSTVNTEASDLQNKPADMVLETGDGHQAVEATHKNPNLVDEHGLQIQPEPAPENVSDILKQLIETNSIDIDGNRYVLEDLGGKKQLLDQAGNLIAEDEKQGFLGKLFGQSENKNIKLALEKIAQGKNIG